MSILCVIPARGGSKGVPRKNIKDLGDKPLIGYTIETALQIEGFNDIIVSTEDEEIKDISIGLGARVPFLRPGFLASDKAPTVDVIVDLVDRLEKEGIYFDAVCLLQPTFPFRDLGEVKNAILKFKDEELDSLISVRKVPDHYNPHWVFEDKEGFLKISTGEEKIITRRQNLPQYFYRDGSLYIVKTSILKNQHSLYGEKIGYYENKNSININIDTLDDWEKAENYINEKS